MKNRLLAISLLLILTPITAAQDQQCIFVDSWQKGTEAISYQIIRITLGPNQSDYVTDLVGKSGKRYRLKVIHNPFADVKMEHWQVELREILIPTSDGKDTLGSNLLTVESPGPDKHNFPPEDFIGYLYPHENPPVTIIGGKRFIESHFFYPIGSTRKIRVEGFYVTIKVENYRRSAGDENKVDFLDLSIEFRDAYSQKV